MTLKDHLKLFLADFLVQLLGTWSRRLVFNLLHLTTRQRHISWERAKMTRQLWFRVLNAAEWRCARCGVVNWKNQQPGRPKMQVDHIVALYNWGLTVWSNLQCLCGSCNRRKGVS